MDDVFDEYADETEIAAVEWKNLETNRRKDGLRDGVERGRDVNLQKGFDTGYAKAVDYARRLGKLRGILRYLSLCGGTVT